MGTPQSFLRSRMLSWRSCAGNPLFQPLRIQERCAFWLPVRAPDRKPSFQGLAVRSDSRDLFTETAHNLLVKTASPDADLQRWLPRLVSVWRASRRASGPSQLHPKEIRELGAAVRTLSLGLTRERSL